MGQKGAALPGKNGVTVTDPFAIVDSRPELTADTPKPPPHTGPWRRHPHTPPPAPGGWCPNVRAALCAGAHWPRNRSRHTPEEAPPDRVTSCNACDRVARLGPRRCKASAAPGETQWGGLSARDPEPRRKVLASRTAGPRRWHWARQDGKHSGPRSTKPQPKNVGNHLTCILYMQVVSLFF